jgi:hypothetical protein
MRSILIVSFVAIVSTFNSQAEEKKKENVLDFEADVIEGDRKRPDLFLEVKGEDLDIEGLLYMRNNFNDFYEMSKPKHYHFVKKK